MSAPEVLKPPGGTADADHNQTHDDILLPDPDAARIAAAAADKDFAGVRASAALHAGIEVYILSDVGGRVEYVARKWGWTKSFRDLGSLKTWLAQVTGGAV